MDKVEFIEAVQRRSTIGSAEEAERSIRKTLEVFTEHLGGDRATNLAAELPPEIAQYLSHEQGEAGKAFALSDFVDNVYHRGDALHPEEATVRAQAVLQTVEEAVTEGEAREDAASPLPQEFAPLLGEEGAAESGLPGAGG
ncbi:MAG: DUF2267 domain-containing protein [Actinobacteria bacterium]|nr:DUF2267 domain-containing protein [Actinomycetota bacterium]MCA1739145.1 DUF2267 domain-containing protein [Actinomycetota bacterium]